MTVVDFSKHSSKKRFFVIDMSTGVVWPLHVAHGSGSDPKDSGFATIFGNQQGSEMSSLGFYLTGEIYSGAFSGRSMRVHGLSAGNSNALDRAIVIHGMRSVVDVDILQGLSWGCFALPIHDKDKVITEMSGGALLYAGLSD